MKKIYILNFIKRIYLRIVYKFKNILIFNNPKKYINNKSKNNIKKPIYLLGISSGGLTIISRIIRRHPNIVSASGDHNYFYGLDELNQYYKIFIPKPLNIFRFKKNTPPYYEFYGIKKYLKYSVIKKKNFSQHSKKYIKILNAILKVFSKNPSKDRLIDKSQNNSLNIDFLDYSLKDCSPYYLLIVNNPYAVIAKNFIKLGIDNEKNLNIAIENYLNIFNRAFKSLNLTKNKYLIINFDDFLKKPEKIMKKIFYFLELKFKKNFMPSKNDLYLIKTSDYKWYPIRKNTHKKYISRLSKNHIELIKSKCSKIIKKFNFVY